MKRLTYLSIVCLFASCAIATVPEQTPWEVKHCDGVTTGFTATFRIQASSDVKVILLNTSTTPYTATTLTETTNYAVTVANGRYPASAFTVTTVSAYGSDYDLIIATQIDLTQTTALTAGQWNPASVERMVDKSRLIENEINRRLAQTIRNPETFPTTTTSTLPQYGSSGYMYRASDGGVSLVDSIDTNSVPMSALWQTWLTEPNLRDAMAAMSLDGTVDAAWWDPNGDGAADDTLALQGAIDYAIAQHRGLKLRTPSVAYRITDTLTVGTGTSVVVGFRWVGEGRPKILWDGAVSKTIIDAVSLEDGLIENIHIDGNDCANVVGVKLRAAPTFPTQGVTLRGVLVENCSRYGVWCTQDANATCDYFTFNQCGASDNGIHFYIDGDVRQANINGGRYLTAGTYSVEIASGHLYANGVFFGRSGTADLCVSGPLASFCYVDVTHESNEVMVTTGTADHYSPLAGSNTMIRCRQDLYTTPWTAQTAIDYNCYKVLTLEGCSFVGDVNVEPNSLGVISINTEFVPLAYSGITAGFVNNTSKVTTLGVGTDGSAYVGVGLVRPTELLQVNGHMDLASGYYLRGDTCEWTVVSKTANYAVAATDSEKTLSSVKAITFELEPAVVGLRHRFRQADTNDLTIDPNASETFDGNAAGHALRLDDKGCWVEISCYATGAWSITGAYDPNMSDHQFFKPE